MVKQIHNLVLTRSHAKEAFGFRIIGGKEQGLTFKVRRLGIIIEKSFFGPGYGNVVLFCIALTVDVACGHCRCTASAWIANS